MPIVPIRIKDSQKGAVWDTPAAELPRPYSRTQKMLDV